MLMLLCAALLLCTWGAAAPNTASAAAPAFAKGTDISWVAGLEAQGQTWKDKNGKLHDG